MAAPLYTTADELRAELGLDETQFDDDRAGRLIVQAEDEIDEWLGSLPVDPATGRKIVEVDVEPWQWERIERAAVQLAALIYRQPDVVGQRWRSVSGPDFAMSGPIGSVARQVVTTLAGTGLAKRWGRATR